MATSILTEITRSEKERSNNLWNEADLNSRYTTLIHTKSLGKTPFWPILEQVAGIRRPKERD